MMVEEGATAGSLFKHCSNGAYLSLTNALVPQSAHNPQQELNSFHRVPSQPPPFPIHLYALRCSSAHLNSAESALLPLSHHPLTVHLAAVPPATAGTAQVTLQMRSWLATTEASQGPALHALATLKTQSSLTQEKGLVKLMKS